MLNLPYINFTKSVMIKRRTWNRPPQGAKECARRVKQGITNYNKHLHYSYQRTARLRFLWNSPLNTSDTIKMWEDCQCINKLGLKELKCNECPR